MQKRKYFRAACVTQRSEVPVACRGHLKTLALSWEKQPLDILSSITKEILNNNQCENTLFLFDHWCRKLGHIIKSREEKKHVETNNGKNRTPMVHVQTLRNSFY